MNVGKIKFLYLSMLIGCTETTKSIEPNLQGSFQVKFFLLEYESPQCRLSGPKKKRIKKSSFSDRFLLFS